MPTRQIDDLGRKVLYFDPVRKGAIAILEAPRVLGHELIDHELGTRDPDQREDGQQAWDQE